MAILIQPQQQSIPVPTTPVYYQVPVGSGQQRQSQGSPSMPISPSVITKVPAVASTINSAGASLGFGNTGAPALGTVGPTQAAGSLGTTTTLGSTLGAAGLGALGGTLLAKGTSGNPTGGSIGGALGGALGAYGAGTTTGAALGTALGLGSQSLNLVAPGLGIIVGGLAGSLLGNKEKPTTASDFSGTIGSTGSLSGIGYGFKGTDSKPAEMVASNTSDYFTNLKQATGIDFTGEILRGGMNTKQMGGGYLQVDSRGSGNNPDIELGGTPQSFKFNINDPQDVNRALGDTAVFLAQRNGLSPDQVKQIQQFNEQRRVNLQRISEGLPTGSGGGVPTVKVRQPTSGQTFSDFYSNYKKQQEQNKAI